MTDTTTTEGVVLTKDYRIKAVNWLYGLVGDEGHERVSILEEYVSGLEEGIETLTTQQAWDMRSLEITVENLRAEVERLREALRQVCNWADAYPEDFFLFAEPDWIKVRELLEAGGITLDSVSAGAIRRAVTDIGETSRAALEGGE